MTHTSSAPDQTQSALPLPRRAAEATPSLVPALVLVWSREEPHRVGEVLLISPAPATASAATRCLFGRGGADFDPRTFLELFRQRPGSLEPCGGPRSPRISRLQWEIRAVEGGISIENRGKCSLRVNGEGVERATAQVGDIVELEDELMFLCTRRPSFLAPLSAAALPAEALPVRANVLLPRFGEPDVAGLVGESIPAWELRRQLAFAGPLARGHVLILGPSGSGKELAAQTIHHLSPRARQPFVSRNAATFTDTLIDAELFGTARDFPQKGMPERPGLVGAADGSTLFLDEIAELPESHQVRLLRVLDREGEYQMLGDSRTRRSDLRLVGATNRPLEFLKHDLLARLKIRIEVPDLNSRREDIPLIARQLVRNAARDSAALGRFLEGPPDTGYPRFTPELVRGLLQHTYSTHVRELDALLWQAIRQSPDVYLELTAGVRARLAESRATPAIEASIRLEPLPVPVPVPVPMPVPASESTPAGGSVGHLRPDTDPWSDGERTRLALHRLHEFSPTACGRDPAYPGGRQKADLHLRQLFCRALRLSKGDVQRVVTLIAGPAEASIQLRVKDRLQTFLSNLRERVDQVVQDPSAQQHLVDTLADEYKAYQEDIRWVLEHLIKGSSRTP